MPMGSPKEDRWRAHTEVLSSTPKFMTNSTRMTTAVGVRNRRTTML